MIDLHCHILPNVDDGAKNWEESLAMARLAVEEGITHILATPHHKNRNWFNPKNEVVNLTNELQNRLDQENIDLTIFPGQEVRLHGNILKSIEKNEIAFVDEGQRYLLIEFPSSTIPTYTDRLLFEVQNRGVTPVIVHPERNQAIIKNPTILKDFVDRGIITQLTAGSYVGAFGREIEKLSEQLLDANIIHYIASDAHNITTRPFHMNEAFEKLEKNYGQERVNNIYSFTKDLVNGVPVTLPITKELPKKKKFFGLF